MIWNLVFLVWGIVFAGWSLYQERRNKLHLSRNNWTSFWKGISFGMGTWLAVLSLVNLVIGA